MTYSTTINSTITKETEASQARAGSPKTEYIQSKSNFEMTDFMKKYRAYSRLQRRVRAPLDEYCVRQYGQKMAFHFDKMDEFNNRLPSCNVHRRMAFRVVASKDFAWKQNQLRLEKMWRYWSV